LRWPQSPLGIIVALALAAPCAAASPRADQPRELTLKLATWNLYWLDSDLGDGEVRRAERDYQRLRRYARRLDADVVAFQEVEDERAARRVFEPDRYAVVLERRQGEQRVGFAYKRALAARGVSVRRNPDLEALDVGGLRHGVDITLVASGRELRLLNVHLKAGCYSDAARDARACRKLKAQLGPLERWIDARPSRCSATSTAGFPPATGSGASSTTASRPASS